MTAPPSIKAKRAGKKQVRKDPNDYTQFFYNDLVITNKGSTHAQNNELLRFSWLK